MATVTVPASLKQGKLLAGGASQIIRNFPTVTYQLLIEPGVDNAVQVDVLTNLNEIYDYYIIEKYSASTLVLSLQPYVAPTTGGIPGIINNNQIFVNPTGIDVTEIQTIFNVTSFYLTNLGGSAMEVDLHGYTYQNNVTINTGDAILSTDNLEEITTDSGEQILAEG